jgi:hypothetical protein
MQIPVYNAPQVAAQLTPDAQLDPHRILRGAGDAFGTEMGEKIQGAAGQLAHIQATAQDEADQLRAQDAFNKVMPDVQNLTAKIKTITGGNVLDPKAYGADPGVSLVDATMQTHKALMDNASDGLTGGALKYFNQLASRSQVEVNGVATNQMVSQTQAHAQSIPLATIGNLQSKVGQNATDPAIVNDSIGGIKQTVAQYASLVGMSPEQEQLFTRQQVGAARTTQVQALLASNLTGPAYQVLGEAKKNDEITGPEYEALLEKVKGKNDLLVGMQAGDVALKQTLLPDGTVQIERASDILKQQRDAGTLSVEAYKVADQQLKEAYAVHKEQIEATDSSGINAALKIRQAPGGTTAAALLAPEVQNLSGKGRMTLNTYLHAIDHRNDGEPAGPAQFAAYWALTGTPEALAKLKTTPDSVIFSQIKALGLPMMERVLQVKQQLNSPGKEIPISASMQVIKEIAESYGVDPKAKDDNGNVGGQMGQIALQSRLDIAYEQERLGRPLSEPEMQTIVGRNSVKVIRTSPGTLWGLFGPHRDEVPLAMVSDPATIEVPSDDKEKIVTAFKNNGVTAPTDAQIRQAYLAGKTPNLTVAPPVIKTPRVPITKGSK